MTDVLVRGIVIKSLDYKDDDKIVRLYTLEQGKIGVLIRGVKKKTAKLKIAAQIFCFGEYLLSGRKDFPLVTGCTVGESFFSIASDPDKYAAAVSVIEILDKALPDNESNPQGFIQTLKTMKELLRAHTYGEGAEIPTEKACKTVLLNFLLRFLALSGYRLKLHKCVVCGEGNLQQRRFDFSSGGVACRRCAAGDAVVITPLCNAVMLAADNCETDRLYTLNLDINGLDEGLAICRKTAERVFETVFISMSNFG